MVRRIAPSMTRFALQSSPGLWGRYQTKPDPTVFWIASTI
jgi:hypothetical protein